MSKLVYQDVVFSGYFKGVHDTHPYGIICLECASNYFPGVCNDLTSGKGECCVEGCKQQGRMYLTLVDAHE